MQNSRSAQVPAAKSKSPLLAYLVETFPEFKKTKIKQMLKFGSARVNDRVVTQFDHALKAGDTVELRLDKKPSDWGRGSWRFPIVYEDDALIVIDKPAGLLTVATENMKTETAYYQLNEYLKKTASRRRERVFIVHRLDKDASGLIVFAKTMAAKEFLQRHWKDVEKKYFAVVQGVPTPETGVIDTHLKESGAYRVYSTPPGGDSKRAVTHYKVLRKTGRRRALLEILLVTGRKNQIRVHLSEAGHPILGDKKYGATEDPVRRLALHAFYLSFKHPLTGEQKQFKTGLPEILGRLMEKAD